MVDVLSQSECLAQIPRNDARLHAIDHQLLAHVRDEPFKLPEGTQGGTAFRLRGRGMPDVTGRGKGDMIFRVTITTPKKLSKDQKKLLEQLQASLPKEKFEPTPVGGEDKGLFDRVKDIFG